MSEARLTTHRDAGVKHCPHDVPLEPWDDADDAENPELQWHRQRQHHAQLLERMHLGKKNPSLQIATTGAAYGYIGLRTVVRISAA